MLPKSFTFSPGFWDPKGRVAMDFHLQPLKRKWRVSLQGTTTNTIRLVWSSQSLGRRHRRVEGYEKEISCG